MQNFTLSTLPPFCNSLKIITILWDYANELKLTLIKSLSFKTQKAVTWNSAWNRDTSLLIFSMVSLSFQKCMTATILKHRNRICIADCRFLEILHLSKLDINYIEGFFFNIVSSEIFVDYLSGFLKWSGNISPVRSLQLGEQPILVCELINPVKCSNQ